MQTVAAVTMVRDDAFFLTAWLRYYGQMLGRENCYIVNHGRSTTVAALAEGCNIVGIPADPHKNFDVKRWGLLNNLVGGLRRYYRHVVVGDVDELVLMDPACGVDLRGWLETADTKRIYTPLGLELIHRIDVEVEPVHDVLVGPRRHVRPAPHYSKPCVVSAASKLSRGGHFAQYSNLHTPDDMYLIHLKYCDFQTYVETMNRRNSVASDSASDAKGASIGRHWFANARGEDRALFEGFGALEIQTGFDLSWVRKRMQRSFGPRGKTGYFHFKRPEYQQQYRLPERFLGMI
jgi:hypothetical protein